MSVFTVDKRIGSAELAKYLIALELPVTLATLPFGDFAFLGLGEGGAPVTVGIERKTLSDFLTSMQNGRLPGHQLPGLLKTYQDIWIVLEGVWRVDYKTGRIQVPKGKQWVTVEYGPHFLTPTTLETMMLTLELKGGVRFRMTRSKAETGRFLQTLYRWWTAKDWEAHRSHLKFSTAGADQTLLIKPSLCRVMAADLPGVGWVRSGPVAQRFKTVLNMVLADEGEWAGIKGIGKGIAAAVVKAMREEK